MALIIAAVLALSIGGEPLKFEKVAQGATSQIEEPRTVAVRSAAEWTALWREHQPGGKPPAIDFKTSMVLAVFAGTKPTAAHAIEITQVDAGEAGIVVTYRETAPAPSDMVAQVLTMPFHIVRTDARAGKVSFQRAGTK
jgi:hypothetical protein